MSKRDYIPLKTRLAAALCHMMKPDGRGGWERIITHEQAKQLTEGEILGMFDFHHYPIAKAIGGPDVHWNLPPVVRPEHQVITAKVDIPRNAKTKRITEKHDAFRRRVLAKVGVEIEGGSVGKRHKRKIPSRPFPKSDARSRAWGRR